MLAGSKVMGATTYWNSPAVVVGAQLSGMSYSPLTGCGRRSPGRGRKGLEPFAARPSLELSGSAPGASLTLLHVPVEEEPSSVAVPKHFQFYFLTY